MKNLLLLSMLVLSACASTPKDIGSTPIGNLNSNLDLVKENTLAEEVIALRIIHQNSYHNFLAELNYLRRCENDLVALNDSDISLHNVRTAKMSLLKPSNFKRTFVGSNVIKSKSAISEASELSALIDTLDSESENLREKSISCSLKLKTINDRQAIKDKKSLKNRTNEIYQTIYSNFKLED